MFHLDLTLVTLLQDEGPLHSIAISYCRHRRGEGQREVFGSTPSFKVGVYVALKGVDGYLHQETREVYPASVLCCQFLLTLDLILAHQIKRLSIFLSLCHSSFLLASTFPSPSTDPCCPLLAAVVGSVLDKAPHPASR